jgi:hypothetical protein
LNAVDEGMVSSNDLYINVEKIVLASQGSSSLFKLHLNAREVHQVALNVSGQFGFRQTELEDAHYLLKLNNVFPDGGTCVEGFSYVMRGLTYTLSVLTLGVLPVTSGHCYVVMGGLYERIDGEFSLVGEFSANQGSVDVYAGANEVDNYQLTVTERDEYLALETSMGSFFNQMIQDGAFE